MGEILVGGQGIGQSGSVLFKNFVPSLSRDETLRMLKPLAASWWQSMEFGHGISIRTRHDAPRLLDMLKLPEDMEGKTVLDIGAAEGFFSFECEARGAKSVEAVDLPDRQVSFPETSKRSTRFGSAKRIYSSGVRLRQCDILGPDAEMAGRHDIVLFLGVLYHLKDPFLAIRRLRGMTREMLVVETHITRPTQRMGLFGGRAPPLMVFYEKGELEGDASNWWGPNAECLCGMLRAAGFSRIEMVREMMDKRTGYGRAIAKAYP